MKECCKPKEIWAACTLLLVHWLMEESTAVLLVCCAACMEAGWRVGGKWVADAWGVHGPWGSRWQAGSGVAMCARRVQEACCTAGVRVGSKAGGAVALVEGERADWGVAVAMQTAGNRDVSVRWVGAPPRGVAWCPAAVTFAPGVPGSGWPRWVLVLQHVVDKPVQVVEDMRHQMQGSVVAVMVICCGRVLRSRLPWVHMRGMASVAAGGCF